MDMNLESIEPSEATSTDMSELQTSPERKIYFIYLQKFKNVKHTFELRYLLFCF